MIAWIRRLEVKLTSRKLKKSFVFGVEHLKNKDDLSISVTGHKYMSTLKDDCTIQISNLTQAEVVQIIQGEFYDVEVLCGYKSSSVMTIFKGGVLYISNRIDDRKTNTVIILCASDMVAKYGQSRINLSLNSGINMYSAINFICRRAGVQNTNVSTQLKKTFLQNMTQIDSTAASWIDQLCSSNLSYISNSDSSINSSLSIFDASKSNQRVIKLRSDNIILTQYPQLTQDGLQLSMMPTFNFMCGDTIEIDNSLIQIPVSNKSEISKNYGYYLDKEGHYMIYQINYTLQNRGPQFSLNLLCKSRSLISNLIGVAT